MRYGIFETWWPVVITARARRRTTRARGISGGTTSEGLVKNGAAYSGLRKAMLHVVAGDSADISTSSGPSHASKRQQSS
jgi:hypothetical protein